MRLYFIRHGQSVNNHLWDTTGTDEYRSEDPVLTLAGWEQARFVAVHLRDAAEPWDGKQGQDGFGITHLYCSPMYRALTTGNEIATALDLPLSIWTDWHEGGGMYLLDRETGKYIEKPGMTRDEIVTLFPRAIPDEHIRDNGWWNRPYETHDLRIQRARRVTAALIDRHGGTQDRVAVVGHGGFYVRFAAALMNIDDTRPLWLRMNNTGISRFDFGEREFALVFHNLITHLPARLVT
jgi:2,3-bisphosphoglycerate-dependent phosphoglycerate mutase